MAESIGKPNEIQQEYKCLTFQLQANTKLIQYYEYSQNLPNPEKKAESMTRNSE